MLPKAFRPKWMNAVDSTTRETSWTDRRLNRVKAEITTLVNLDRRGARLRMVRDLILRTATLLNSVAIR
jgi:hypothetical protein